MQEEHIVVTEENINILFGKKIKEIRTSLGVSQEEFGFMLGLHRTYIGQIERAEKNASIKTLAKICDGLKIDLKELLDFSKIK